MDGLSAWMSALALSAWTSNKEPVLNLQISRPIESQAEVHRDHQSLNSLIRDLTSEEVTAAAARLTSSSSQKRAPYFLKRAATSRQSCQNS